MKKKKQRMQQHRAKKKETTEEEKAENRKKERRGRGRGALGYAEDGRPAVVKRASSAPSRPPAPVPAALPRSSSLGRFHTLPEIVQSDPEIKRLHNLLIYFLF